MEDLYCKGRCRTALAASFDFRQSRVALYPKNKVSSAAAIAVADKIPFVFGFRLSIVITVTPHVAASPKANPVKARLNELKDDANTSSSISKIL